MTLSILNEFAQGRANSPQAIRALIAHDGWFVPVEWAVEVCKLHRFETIVACGEPTTPSDRLCLFTSKEAVHTAEERCATDFGLHLGPYGGPLPGSTVFAQLSHGFTSFEVDPFCIAGPNFSLVAAGIDLARRFTSAVALENSLFDSASNAIQQILDFDHYIVLVTASGAPVTAIGAAGMKNPALVFTAEDAIEPLRASGMDLSPYRQVFLKGQELFTRFEEMGVDGILLRLDPNGPRAKPFSLEACRKLAQAVRSRAEGASFTQSTLANATRGQGPL